MSQYNLTAPEKRIIVSWLFESGGYLDADPQGTETALIWWIRLNDQVNIVRADLPPQVDVWVALLNGWDVSIKAGFERASQSNRNVNTVPIYDKTGTQTDTMPAGAQLAHQQSLIRKVLGVLT